MYTGIDLGTSNTLCAAINSDGAAIIVPDVIFRDYQFTPSVVYLEGRQALAGVMAEMTEEFQQGTSAIRYIKRSFGLQRPVHVDSEGRNWFPESLAALLLKKVRFDAELQNMQTVKGAVITVPAHYNDAQRRSVIEAAKLAEVPLMGLLDEPVAAALYYGQHVNFNDKLVLIYDLGGGTFDLTLLTRADNTLHVLAKDGVSNLGGKEFDDIITNDILQQFRFVFGTDPDLGPGNIQKLGRISEQIKIDFTSSPKPDWIYRWISLSGDRMFEYSLNPAVFLQKIEPKLSVTVNVLQRCLRGLGVRPGMLDKIVLIGGGSKMPSVRQYIETNIPEFKGKIESFEPLQAVAKGAALYASMIGTGTGALNLKTVSTYNIALDTHLSNVNAPTAGTRFDKLIPKNSPLPVTASRTLQTDGSKRLQLSLVQFWEENGEIFHLGNITAEPFGDTAAPVTLELLVENRVNGTIGVKLVRNGSVVPVAFQRENSGYRYDYSEQYSYIKSLVLNNVY